jgi:hypothetical protein
MQLHGFCLIRIAIVHAFFMIMMATAARFLPSKDKQQLYVSCLTRIAADVYASCLIRIAAGACFYVA